MTQGVPHSCYYTWRKVTGLDRPPADPGEVPLYWLVRFQVQTALPGGRHNGACLLHWSGLHLETAEPSRAGGPSVHLPDQVNAS